MFLSALPFKSYINEKPFLFISLSWLIITWYFSYLIFLIEKVLKFYSPKNIYIASF